MSGFWSVVQAVPQRERLAVKELEEAGFDVYFPKIRFRQNRRWRITGLFPGYLFIQISDRWWSARWCRGVLRLLGVDGAMPARLPENVIGEIRKQEKNGFVVLKPKPDKLKKGQQVRIVGGRFDGRIAIFEGQNSRERQRVLLELLGQWVNVELAATDRCEPQDVVAPGLVSR
jgi:transcription antitermination factor NusG